MRPHALRILLVALVVLAVGHAARFYALPVLGNLDAFFYDAKVRLSADSSVDPRVVIVDIDEKSLQQIGRWPWSRDRVAALLDRLFDDYHVAVLGFDVVFAEPDTSSGLATLENLASGTLKADPAYQAALKQLRPKLDYDARLAAAISGRSVVLGYYFGDLSGGMQANGVLPKPSLQPGTFQGRAVAFSSWDGFGGNLARLQQVAAGAGHFNPQLDFDGVTRRVPLLAQYRCPTCDGPAYYEALSLAVVRQVLGMPRIVPGYPDGASGSAYAAMEWVSLPLQKGELRIPVDEDGAVLVPFHGPRGHFRYVSATDILSGRVPAEQLNNRIVLMGATAPGLMDLRVTPLDPVYPGVELHANLIAGMLDGTIKSRPSYVVGADVLMIGLCGLLLVWLLPRASPVRATVLAGAGVVFLLTVNLAAWFSAQLVLPLAAGLAMVLVLYGCTMCWGYFIVSASKRQFAELFEQYVPPVLVDEMARNPAEYTMAGRKADLSVMFSGIRGFTAISEALEPDQLAALMKDYLGEMTSIIRRCRGSLDKYMGDAIMAFWGAPVADAEHARHAVVAALEMQRVLVSLNDRLALRDLPRLKIGIGINTGAMTVGDMGSSLRRTYTVVGDTVNLGARLEAITQHYGVGIIVGEDTRRQLKGQIVFRELDSVQVKGRSEPVRIFEPLGVEDAVDSETLDQLKLWNQALRAYRAQQWDQAEVTLLNLVRQVRQPLFVLFMERISRYRRAPPGPDWNGVAKFDRKDDAA